MYLFLNSLKILLKDVWIIGKNIDFHGNRYFHMIYSNLSRMLIKLCLNKGYKGNKVLILLISKVLNC
jgi:hypothetical protein